jgi:hypothetical protein
VKRGASKNKPSWENVRRIEWKERGDPKSEEWRKGVLMCFHVECESPDIMWVRSDKDLDKE